MSGPDPLVEHLRSATLAAVSGLAATAALLLSPWGEGIPPIVLAPFPLDLRFALLPSLFVVAHVSFARSRWPLPGLVLPALALLLAGVTHIQASALVDFLTAFRGSDPGERINLGATLATGASLLLALAAALDRGRDQLVRLARRAGAPEESLPNLHYAAALQGNRTLAFTGAAFVAFTFIARVGDGILGGERAPLPELVGAGLAVGVAVLLFPGVVAAARQQRAQVSTPSTPALQAEEQA